MLHLGNYNLNKIFESNLLESKSPSELIHRNKVRSILSNSSHQEKTNWISTKYVEKSFCNFENLNVEEVNIQFWISCKEKNLKNALFYLLQKCDVNYKNNESDDDTALHLATRNKHFYIIEFLYQWTANFNLGNKHGQTPLHLAAESGDSELVWFLLKKGSDQNVLDFENQTPLDLAHNSAHPNVTTAFKYYEFLKDNTKIKRADFTFEEAIQNIGSDDVDVKKDNKRTN